MRRPVEINIDQRTDWKWLMSAQGKNFRNLLSRRFARKFPLGHDTSLRAFIEQVAGRRARGEQFTGYLKILNSVHPAGLRLLLEYGVDYVPYEWTTVPFEPRPRHCFENAWLLAHLAMENDRVWAAIPPPILYVEGLAYGSIVRPMLHAWNTQGFGSRTAVDWTHYSVCPWSRYLGIPFTLDEYWSICRLRNLEEGCAIFHKDHLTERMIDRIASIIDARKQ
ncbi:MAG: hypothetical protein UY97_C0001G0040 [Parcubacteria group bacterium GW2011_GWB1_57_6]|nr:MAG: hypothetical protein UY93_C0001G0035 [Parcubacteria group bacterium GW2011_GWA1_56_13]KKW46983.1 MAG: hypothetical protein UY97_C0001G0040 [Parcubacteria group bacterium GW2011_GWB1_57_6]